MKFLQLLDGAEVLSARGDAEITGIEYDSRRVQPGNCFVAIRGETVDGNRFISAAISNGAAAIVSELEPRPDIVPWATVEDGRRALARVSANFYKRPAERLAMTGITGTNGKTTTAFLVESILHAAGRRSALIGTIEYHIAGRTVPAPHTTPESLELNRLLAEGLGNGATEGVMEVSSHALVQGRAHGVPFDVAIFTNLTRDHLDYHHTFDEYFAAKRILFEGMGTEPPRIAVINADDEYGVKLARFAEQHGSDVFTYGIHSGEHRAENIEVGLNGTRFDFIGDECRVPLFSPLMGRVNVYNALAAAVAGMARGCTRQQIAAGIAILHRVPGRFEKVDVGQPFTVVVDYAHTDDALRNLTSLAREFVTRGPQHGRVITLFGCGGDRDRAKRPMMAEAAGKGSDFVVLTSDNPRSEDPRAIIEDALPGFDRSCAPYAVEPDRRKAIQMAIERAQPGDIVLLAGKGHEKTQTTREGIAPFDDVEVARAVLVTAGYGRPAGETA